jgi:hypothetical protein
MPILPPTPADIVALFKEKWVGTDEELSAALEHFFNDIRSTVELALEPLAVAADVLLTMDDYFSNHYGD